MNRYPSHRSRGSLRIKRLSPRRYACLFRYIYRLGTYTDMLLKRADVSTDSLYSSGYIEGVFANGLCVCRICKEPLRVMRLCTHTHPLSLSHTHNMYIYMQFSVKLSRWMRYMKCSVCVMSSDSEDVLSSCSLNAGQRGGVRVITALAYLLCPQKDRLHLYV